MRPWYGLSNYGLEICYTLAQYYDVYMWDGDGMLTLPHANTSSGERILCYTYWFNESKDVYPISPIISYNNDIYIATKFLAMVHEHVYGGIIKYNPENNHCTIYVYDNAGKTMQYVIKDANYTAILLGIICNTHPDKNDFGYTRRASIMYVH